MSSEPDEAHGKESSSPPQRLLSARPSISTTHHYHHHHGGRAAKRHSSILTTGLSQTSEISRLNQNRRRRRRAAVTNHIFCFAIAAYHYIGNLGCEPTGNQLEYDDCRYLLEADLECSGFSGANRESILNYFRTFWRKIPERYLESSVDKALETAVHMGYLKKDDHGVYYRGEERPKSPLPLTKEPAVEKCHKDLADKVKAMIAKKQEKLRRERDLKKQAWSLQEWKVKHMHDVPVAKPKSKTVKTILHPQPKLVIKNAPLSKEDQAAMAIYQLHGDYEAVF